MFDRQTATNPRLPAIGVQTDYQVSDKTIINQELTTTRVSRCTQTKSQANKERSSGNNSLSASSCSSTSSIGSESIGQRPAGDSFAEWPAPRPEATADDLARRSSDGCVLLLNVLPPIPATNSILLKQRLSAKGSLVSASANPGAGLPLMIGQRGQQKATDDEQPANISRVTPNVPQNTAIRAEQRKQNVVSVVRPVVSEQVTSSTCVQNRAKLEDNSIWPQDLPKKSSVLDDFMQLDSRLQHGHLSTGYAAADYRLLAATDQFGHQLARQQINLLRREQMELQKSIVRQHEFLMHKLGDRKRGLSIIQVFWTQRGFKHAIDKLVDLYHQGLVFSSSHGQETNVGKSSAKLSSMNTSLVVDVLGVLLTRPKLWTLDTCQQLLPIISNDLLAQDRGSQFESYLDLGLKSLRLILRNFSSVICAGLEGSQQKSCSGVDLSREDRINKCTRCHKLVIEARGVFNARRQGISATSRGRLLPLIRELEQLFSSYESAINSIKR